MNIAIVGSGLAAISAAKCLISRGLKPTIIDCGNTLEEERSSLVEKLSHLEPSDWNKSDISLLAKNPTVHNKKTFPQKLAFGSDFFYGKADQYQSVKCDGSIPPFSYAKGGFSAGWGAAVLPPDESDLSLWPIGIRELEPYFKKVLAETPYSGSNDDLSSVFPLFSEKVSTLKLSSGNKELLQDLLDYSSLCNEKNFLVGQSRLLVKAERDSNSDGCKYCGYCMSGCVYKYIYKASSVLEQLVSSGQVDYFPNILVQKVSEDKRSVKVETLCITSHKTSILEFDKVLLAAGAVNTTRIVLRSKGLYDFSVRLLSTVTFVAPVFRLKGANVDWPKVNTQPGIFLEFKNKKISNHWIHTQVSTPNELVLEKLGVNYDKNRLIQWLKLKILRHLIIVHGTIHSNYSDGYILTLKKTQKTGVDELHSSRENHHGSMRVIKSATWTLFNILRKVGCFLIIPAVKNSIKSGSFHVGGSLPMKHVPEKELETNVMGNPKGWSKIHVIDSSTFPSLPSTTIGLLAMANASRIASEMNIK